MFIQKEITLRDHSLEKAIWLYSRDKIRWKRSCLGHLVLLLLSISLLRLNKTGNQELSRNLAKNSPCKTITLSTHQFPMFTITAHKDTQSRRAAVHSSCFIQYQCQLIDSICSILNFNLIVSYFQSKGKKILYCHILTSEGILPHCYKGRNVWYTHTAFMLCPFHREIKSSYFLQI